jgi:hypothetical protein
VIERADGERLERPLLCRIDTPIEVQYYRSGGILPYVLGELLGVRAARTRQDVNRRLFLPLPAILSGVGLDPHQCLRFPLGHREAIDVRFDCRQLLAKEQLIRQLRSCRATHKTGDQRKSRVINDVHLVPARARVGTYYQ